MRASHLLALSFLMLAGCANMHSRSDDGGTSDAATCASLAPFWCVAACGTDALAMPTCADDVWSCPPEAPINLSTCPPSCPGPRLPGCVCVGTMWECDDSACPADLNPWDPSDPVNACRFEGATCTGGSGDSCGIALACRCERGFWSCAVAEPDPACWCGREPTFGASCTGEVATCGQCCPTAEGPNWPAMECVDGTWAPAACPEIVCPPVYEVCPADTASVIGDACAIDAQLCGNPCCGTAITCVAGRWERGPEAACACEPPPACGSGACNTAQYCRTRCGPDDGIEDHCVALPAGCDTCECLPLDDSRACEMVDGRPVVRYPLLCG